MNTKAATIAARLEKNLGRAAALRLALDMANRGHGYSLRERVTYRAAAALLAR